MNVFAPLEPRAFGLVMADPPWRFSTWSDRGVTPKGAGGQYTTMTPAQICELPVRELAADDCVLWLWATNPMLRSAFSVMEAWGFDYVTAGAWVKRTRLGKLAFGTGYTLRCAHEPFLIGRRGKPRWARNVRSVVEGLTREHSRKPDEAYAAAERLAPDVTRRADLFSRESRAGWESWGFEAGKFDAREGSINVAA
ncbi:MAG: MT-A70 family methyltransferase [Alsobacter sp.]